MNKLELVKGVTEFVVGVGVASIVGNAIKVTASPNHGKYKKAAIGIGGFFLSRMVADFTSAYATKEIDETAEKIKKIFGRNDIIVFEKTETEEAPE